jgi:hypothetical protein
MDAAILRINSNRACRMASFRLATSLRACIICTNTHTHTHIYTNTHTTGHSHGRGRRYRLQCHAITMHGMARIQLGARGGEPHHPRPFNHADTLPLLRAESSLLLVSKESAVEHAVVQPSALHRSERGLDHRRCESVVLLQPPEETHAFGAHPTQPTTKVGLCRHNKTKTK